MLVDHPDMAKITFIGPDATGAPVHAQAAKTMKRFTPEPGGKSPNMVFTDCALKQAAAGAISGIVAATGQTCTAGWCRTRPARPSRAASSNWAHRRASARKGGPMRAETNIGPTRTPAEYRGVLDYIETAKLGGAQRMLGDGPADAICIANASIYGLAAGVWTAAIGRAMRLSAALKAGTG